MPDPALPIPSARPPQGVAVEREYFDSARRPMVGVATATPVDGPRTPVMVDVVDGRCTFHLEPGRYSLAAMLRTADRSRVYIAEDIVVTQEDS